MVRKSISLFLLTVVSTFVRAQSLSPFRIQKLTTESLPAGVSVTGLRGSDQSQPAYAVVANSGSNSVTIFELYSAAPAAAANVTNVNTVRTFRILTRSRAARTAATLGAVAYSAACHWDGAAYKAVVSTTGDNTLNVVDLASLSVTQRIPNIPGAHEPIPMPALTSPAPTRYLDSIA